MQSTPWDSDSIPGQRLELLSSLELKRTLDRLASQGLENIYTKSADLIDFHLVVKL